MTNEELCALAQTGDAAAREALVENNLGFVRQTANSFFYRNEELCVAYFISTDDLFQEGCIGLLKAIDLYDPEQGSKFLTYAVKAIRNPMTDLFRKHNDEFETENGLVLSDASLYDVVGDEDKTARIQTIADTQIKTPEQIFIEAEMYAELRAVRHRISKRENDYLDYRYGFIDDIEHGLKETAAHFKLSESRAKSTEKLALDNLWLELPWWYELRRDLARKAKERLRGTKDGG